MKRFFSRLIGQSLAATAITLALPALAHAQTVTNWHSDVEVQPSGTVKITETINYDPQDRTHHGIERLVPTVLTDAQGTKFYSRPELISVKDLSGKDYPIDEKEINRGKLYLRIGDEDETLNGPQTYVIAYTLTPLVTRTSAGDRLNLNIVGNSWQTPIEQMSATVKFAEPGQLTSKACYTGLAGSLVQSCVLGEAGGATTAATTRALEPGEAFTVDLTAPSLGLAAYMEPGKRTPLTGTDVAALIMIGVAAVLWLIGAALRGSSWLARRRAIRDQTIIAQYTPPAGLAPAQLGILETPAADAADATATLIDLAIRGHLKIEQTRAKKWYRAADYRLTRLAGRDELAPFERALLYAIFGEATEQQLDGIGTRRPKLSSDIQAMRQTLGDDLTARGYYKLSPTKGYGAARVVISLLALVFGIIAGGLVFAGETVAIIFAGFAIALGAANLWLSTRDINRTPAGDAEWAYVKGFKLYLEVAEKDRLNFTDAPERTPELFSKLLPYAVALKVEKQWAAAFAGMDVTSAVGGWYTGYAISNFTAGDFATSLNSNFNAAMGTSFSGTSGGGSAGGGGGGGGGGGW